MVSSTSDPPSRGHLMTIPPSSSGGVPVARLLSADEINFERRDMPMTQTSMLGELASFVDKNAAETETLFSEMNERIIALERKHTATTKYLSAVSRGLTAAVILIVLLAVAILVIALTHA